MTSIRCRECNEINDCNACKCENCKASLSDVGDSEVDEKDFLFIEEAESRGQVFDWISPSDDALWPEEDIKVEKEVNGNTISIENYQLFSGTPFNVQKVDEVESRNNGLKADYTQTNSLYECNQCSKSFKRLVTLKSHINNEHGTAHCFEEFNEIKTLPDNSCISPVGSNDSDSEYEPSIEETSYQPIVKSAMKSERKHSDSHTKIKVFKNFGPSSTETKLKRINSKREIVYKCKACEKISANYEEHKMHIVIHTVPEETLTETTSLEQLAKTPSGFIKCDLCEEVFVNEREHSHHQMIHQGRELLQCDICKAFLSTKSSLKKHKKRVHKKVSLKTEKSFECVVCNQKFEAMILMVQHRKTHIDAIKKMEEMTIIKKDDGKTVYVCKVCAKTSKNKYRHEEHLRTHTKEKPFQCDQCGERISTAAGRMHHLRLHENDRPFKCELCDSTYRHKKSLKKHLRLHTGEKPFKCRCCDKTFAFNYTRADHERNIHFGESKASLKRRKQLTEMDEVDACETDKTDVTDSGVIASEAASNSNNSDSI